MLSNMDLVHLHWVCGGLLRLESLRKFRKPIVWTLHDMWAFTGGCHYDEGCGRYKDSCGICPQLKSRRQSDLSRWVWKRKKKAWQDLNITIVTPSQWLAECAKESSLFQNSRIEVIPNGIDTEQYKPFDKKLVREMLKLPQDKNIIIFGAVSATSYKRKGFQYLQEALQKMTKGGLRETTELVVFGSSEPEKPLDLGFKTHYMGQLHDDISIVSIYAASDVFVVPSLQDNLPNTIMESLACGTPVVAFGVGGIPEMIEHRRNGYLAKPEDPNDLAKGLNWVLVDPQRTLKMREAARKKTVKEYALESQAKRYKDLYEDILGMKMKNSSN